MDRLLALIIIFASFSVAAFDHDIIKGQWAVYQNNQVSEPYYYFLHINNDFSGTLVRSFGDEPITNNFKAQDLIKRDGYVEVQLGNNQIAVFSAWKLKSGSGRLSGLIYMYKESGELFNMLHFPLHLLNPSHEFMGHNEIKHLSEIHR